MESHTHEVTNQDLLRDVFPFIQTHGVWLVRYVIKDQVSEFRDGDWMRALQRKSKSLFNSDCKGKCMSLLINPSDLEEADTL